MEISEKLYLIIRKPLVDFCLHFGISANQVTVFNHILTLILGCYFFSRGTYIGSLYGLLICFINGALDYLDGDIAVESNKVSSLGVWLDTGFDLIVQNAIMGAIAIGCFKNGMDVVWIVMFFINNCADILVGLTYNEKFGFTSSGGNKLFRSIMRRKNNLFNNCIKNIVDPVDSRIGLVLLTFRYYIVVGSLLNVMAICFYLITVIRGFRWMVLFVLYGFYLAGNRRLYSLQALSVFDDEQSEYYWLRTDNEKNTSL